VSDFETHQLATAPPWMRKNWWATWLAAHGVYKDALVEGAKLAVKARFVHVAPSDALPYAASERNLEVAPGEAETAFRTRLVTAWEQWQWAGTKKGVVDALALLGYANTLVYEARDPGGIALSDGWDTAKWARFWVLILEPHTWNFPRWGDMTWGEFTWGTTASEVEVRRLQRAVRLWKPAHARCEGILIYVDDEHVTIPV
jgi:hypothetical protein